MASSINSITPPRTTIFNQKLSPIQEQIKQQENVRRTKQSTFWGFINILLLSIVMYDLNYTKIETITYIQYIELMLSLIFSFNIIYHLWNFFKIWKSLQKKSTDNVQKVSKIDSVNDDSRFIYQNLVTNSFSKTPMDLSAASWLTNNSFNNTQNLSSSWSAQTPTARSVSSSWVSSNRTTPNQNTSPKYQTSPIIRSSLSNIELENEERLNQYLKDCEVFDSNKNESTNEKQTNLLSFFWNHPAAKMNKDSSPLLRRCQYQLSTPSSTSSSPKSDDKSSPMNKNSTGLDTWRRLNVDSVALTQWNENLRIWISQTILYRLIKEFDSINKSLHSQGLTDITIGTVGLDRLRKTAQGSVLQSTPNLPTLVPFLELHSNQEYLVNRIRQLAKGGCMSEYKWNGGSSYNGKDWETSLPTDAAIVMHLTACYLDTQLLPLPSKPDIKPFSGYHFIRANEKLPELLDNTLAIHEVTVNPPHYRVIIGRESYEMVKGYSNLFHSILLFLYHVNKREHGMLGRVNLGRSGVNLLWIIQSN